MPLDASGAPSGVGSNVRLNSWKEIASYLRCGVRSVQRWEKTEGFPIHRHLHQAQGSIYAFTSEIDDWRSRRSSVSADRALITHRSPSSFPFLAGRSPELARLRHYWESALAGAQRTVFVSGSIGVGKTALVRAFLDSLESAWIIQGECVEQYGAGEAYLPVIEGLERLVRLRENRPLVTVMGKYAPSWVMHIPSLSRDPSDDKTAGPRPDRMIRDFIDALEVLSLQKPVVLVLEDLHWSDRSTVELIDRIARRNSQTRIFVLGTYRLGEWADREPPLMHTLHELEVHSLCHDIRVQPLSESDVSEYLGQRGSWHDLHGVARQIHRWTSGIPLFMNILLDDLSETQRLTLIDGAWHLAESLQKNGPPIAPTIRHIIDDRIRRLTPQEQQLLEAASVAGHTFFAAVVAAAVGLELTHVEQAFESLSRRHQFIERHSAEDSLGDVVTARYTFLHSLYQHSIYDRLSPSSRAEFHRAMGCYLENVFQAGREDLAGELAMHFERSRDFKRAATYYDTSAAIALARGADHEAHTSALKALEQLAKAPAGPERQRQELSVRLKVCAAVSNMSSMGDPMVERAYSDVLALCERIGADAQVVPALLGIARFHGVCGNVETGRRISQRALVVARASGDPVLCVQALLPLSVLYWSTGSFTESLVHATEAANMSRGLTTDAAMLTSGFHPAASALIGHSWALWFLGYPDQALRSAREAVAIADELSHPQTLAPTKAFVAVAFEWCGSRDQSHDLAATSLALAKKFDLPQSTAFARGVLGWILGRRGSAQGIDELMHSLQLHRSMGVRLWEPMMSAWLAESMLYAGNVTGAAAAIDSGLETARQAGVTYYDAELYGLRAEVLAASLREGTDASQGGIALQECEALARRSYSLAQAQQARSLQLRAAMRLVRLSPHATVDEHYQLLSDTYQSFSEGFSTQDLSDARELLDAAHRPLS